MHRRTFLALAAAAPFFNGAAFADTSAALSYDERGRPMADVMLNGQGPFSLVIDTGAGGTVIGADIIQRLSLTPTGRARMQGASGATETNLYSLSSIQLGALRRDGVNAAEAPENSASSRGHAGVLGANLFSGARLELDFTANLLRVDTSANRAPLAGAGVAPVAFRHRVLALAPVTVGGVAATGLIDTGARRSVANTPLREALGFAANDPRLISVEPIGGATAHTTETVAAQAGPIVLGGADLGALELAFAELAVFRSLELARAPGIILGMDVFRTRTLVLDYATSQVQVRR